MMPATSAMSPNFDKHTVSQALEQIAFRWNHLNA
jgi:hypothetical protein